MLNKVFVVIALLASNSNATSLQPSRTRQKGEDLQVINLDSQGYRAKTLYYTYDQLLTLPTVTGPRSRARLGHMPSDSTSTKDPAT
jgi:hypothetical protein